MSVCKDCGEERMGDGYASVLRCPHTAEAEYEGSAPDAGPFDCGYPAYKLDQQPNFGGLETLKVTAAEIQDAYDRLAQERSWQRMTRQGVIEDKEVFTYHILDHEGWADLTGADEVLTKIAAMGTPEEADEVFKAMTAPYLSPPQVFSTSAARESEEETLVLDYEEAARSIEAAILAKGWKLKGR